MNPPRTHRVDFRSNGHPHPPAPTLITGGAGFIGCNLAHAIARAGRSVIVYDNLSRPGVARNAQELSDTYPKLVDIRQHDVRDHAPLHASIRDAGSVFHLAAQVAVTTSLDDPQSDFDINVRGTFNVLEGLRAVNRPTPLLYTSTNKVYGNLTDVPLVADQERYRPTDPDLHSRGVPESRRLDFCSPYGCSKGAADQYVVDYAHSYNLPTCVFRMSCIYGPRQCGSEDQGWVCHFVRAAHEGTALTIYGDGRQVRDALYIDDLTAAMLLARDRFTTLAGTAFNIGGGPVNTMSLLELLDITARLTGTKTAITTAPWRTGDQRWYVSDTSRFQAATGWAPAVTIPEGVARLYRWLATGRVNAPATPSVARRTAV